mgnify:CR=1 FL=1|tara:strand:- start:82 stop:447 length:366 start_codon:yes stop_codon:yes gene_type:complete
MSENKHQDINFYENYDEIEDFKLNNEKNEVYNNLIVNLIADGFEKFRITKFEKAKIIGIRSTQLESGMPTKLDNYINMNVLEIAEKEFKLGLIPIIIKRKYPNDKIIYVKFNKNNFSNLDL